MAGLTLEQAKQMYGEDGFEIIDAPPGWTPPVEQQLPIQQQLPPLENRGYTLEELQQIYGPDGFEIVGEDNQPTPIQAPVQPTGIMAGFTPSARDISKDRGVLGQIPNTIRSARGEYQQALGQYKRGQITGGELGLRTVGSAANVIGSTVGNAIGSAATQAYQSLPQGVQGRLQRGVQNIGQSEIGQRFGRGLNKIVGAGNQVAQQNPRLAENLKAVGRIASIVPVEAVASQTLKQGTRLGKSLKPGLVALEESSIAARNINKQKNIINKITPTVRELPKNAYLDAQRRGLVSKGGLLKGEKYTLPKEVKNAVIKHSDVISKDATTTRINIANKSARLDQEVGDFLRQKNGIFNKAQLRTTLSSKLEPITDLTVNPKALADAKKKVIDSFVGGLQKNDMESLWKARKEFDRSIESAFSGSPTVQKKIKTDFRNAVQDFISERTDDVTYKSKMKDLSDLIKVDELAKLKAASQKGRSKLDRWIRQNPRQAKVLGTVAVGTAASIVGPKVVRALGIGGQ